MYDRSLLKLALVKALKTWNYKEQAATPYNIARKLNCSESYVYKLLRYLVDEGMVDISPGGSWHI